MNTEKLKQLREKTGVSYALCLKALKEANNDLEKAEKLLTLWGAQKNVEKVNRKTANGGIFTYLHHNKQIASMVEILCETDFVAQNENFRQLGHNIAMQIASLKPKDEKELLNQPFIKDQSKTVGDLFSDAILKFGENIKINRFIYWIVGES
jgi:elongation factor Ts